MDIDEEGNTPLHQAAAKGDFIGVSKLLATEVNIEAKNNAGNTPLACAVYSRFYVPNLKTVELLINHGAKIDTVSVNGYTLLHRACIKKNIDIIKLLIRLGLDVNALNNQGETPLQVAHLNGTYNLLEATDVLLLAGANINTHDNLSFTLLHDAVLSNNFRYVKHLLYHGINKDLKSNDGETAEMFARERNQHEMADYIRDYQPSLEYKEPDF